MTELVCKKCQTPVPTYLYAINFYTSAIIWVNEHAKKVPCKNCGADVRDGNMKVPPQKADER